MLSEEYRKNCSSYSKHLIVLRRRVRLGILNLLKKTTRVVHDTRGGRHWFNRDGDTFAEIINVAMRVSEMEGYHEL